MPPLVPPLYLQWKNSEAEKIKFKCFIDSTVFHRIRVVIFPPPSQLMEYTTLSPRTALNI